MSIKQLSKKELYQFFGCYSPKSFAYNTKRFRKLFFTDDFIENELKLSLDAYNEIKNFTYDQTQIIVNHFKITPDELESI